MAGLAQCRRCQAWTLLDKAGPVPVAVDVTPLDVVGYRDTLLGAVGRWWVEKRQNGATRLRPAPLGSPGPRFAPSGAQVPLEGVTTGIESAIHAEHGHAARDQRVVKPTDPKGSAPAMPGAQGAGSRPQTAHVYAARGPATRSAATPATARPFDPYARCGTCRRTIRRGEIYWGIQHGSVWIMAEHERCPT